MKKRILSNKSNSGFTLLETLLGVMLGMIILLSLYMTWTTGMQLSLRNDATTETIQEIQWTFDQLERDLGNFTNYDFSGSYPKLHAFAADQKSMTFLITTGSGLKAVRYSFEEAVSEHVYGVIIAKKRKKNTAVTLSDESEQKKMRFVRREKNIVDFAQSGFVEGDKPETLLDNLKEGDVQLSFAEQPQDGKKLTLEDVWTKEDAPRLIQMKLQHPAPGTELPPSWTRNFFLYKGFSAMGKPAS